MTAPEVVLRPALRGSLHRWSAPVAVVLTVLVALRAPTGGTRAAVIVYGGCVTAMLAVSGTYHAPPAVPAVRAGCCAGSTTPRSSPPSPAPTRP